MINALCTMGWEPAQWGLTVLQVLARVITPSQVCLGNGLSCPSPSPGLQRLLAPFSRESIAGVMWGYTTRAQGCICYMNLHYKIIMPERSSKQVTEGLLLGGRSRGASQAFCRLLSFPNQLTQKGLIVKSLCVLQSPPVHRRFLGCPLCSPWAHLASEPLWWQSQPSCFSTAVASVTLLSPRLQGATQPDAGKTWTYPEGYPSTTGGTGLSGDTHLLPSLQWDNSEVHSTQLPRRSCPNEPQSAPRVPTHLHTLSCLFPSPALFSHASLSFLFPKITSPQNSLHPKSCLRGTPTKRLTSPVSCRAPQTRSRRTHMHLYPSLNTHY